MTALTRCGIGHLLAASLSEPAESLSDSCSVQPSSHRRSSPKKYSSSSSEILRILSSQTLHRILDYPDSRHDGVVKIQSNFGHVGYRRGLLPVGARCWNGCGLSGSYGRCLSYGEMRPHSCVKNVCYTYSVLAQRHHLPRRWLVGRKSCSETTV